jgi:asparaginyl-tRNA synthetase
MTLISLKTSETESIEDGVRYRYRSIRTERARRILEVQHTLSRAIRSCLDSEGFVELLPPVIGPLTDPGIRGAGTVKMEYYGEPYVVMTSMILYKQMAVNTFPKIYSFSPNIRLEVPEGLSTSRHLAEFYQVDLEVAHGSCESLMDLGDKLLHEVIKSVHDSCTDHLEFLKRDLSVPPLHLPRITHHEAIEMLRAAGHKAPYNEELSWIAERKLSELFETPFWITEYPSGSRGFYYTRDSETPSVLRSMDLILPEGYGEVSSGGEREYTRDGVTRSMMESGEDPSKYGWYISMIEEGILPSAGFGIGVERLTRYVCGVEHIWECSPFPKVPGII